MQLRRGARESKPEAKEINCPGRSFILFSNVTLSQDPNFLLVPTMPFILLTLLLNSRDLNHHIGTDCLNHTFTPVWANRRLERMR